MSADYQPEEIHGAAKAFIEVHTPCTDKDES